MEALEDIPYVESCGFNCKARNIDEVINGLTGFMPRDFSENIMQMKNMIDMMSVMNSMDGGIPNMNQFTNTQNSNYNNINNEYKTNNDLFENIKSILDQNQ